MGPCNSVKPRSHADLHFIEPVYRTCTKQQDGCNCSATKWVSRSKSTTFSFYTCYPRKQSPACKLYSVCRESAVATHWYREISADQHVVWLLMLSNDESSVGFSFVIISYLFYFSIRQMHPQPSWCRRIQSGCRWSQNGVLCDNRCFHWYWLCWHGDFLCCNQR
jgi:hypothetical protein